MENKALTTNEALQKKEIIEEFCKDIISSDEYLGFDITKEGISNFAKSELVTVSSLDFLNSFNHRFKNDEIGTGISSLNARIEGNKKTVNNIIKKGVKENSHIIVITKDMIKKIIKILEEIEKYCDGQIKFISENDFKSIKSSFPKIDDDKMYLVIDGNTTCAAILKCYLIWKGLLNSSTGEKSILPMVEKIGQYYEDKQIRISIYDTNCISSESSFKRDCQFLELISLIVERNRATWNESEVNSFISRLIRLSHLILYRWNKDNDFYNWPRHLRKLTNLYSYILPMHSSDETKDFSNKISCPMVQMALFGGNPTLEYEPNEYERNEADKYEIKISGKLEKTMLSKFNSLFDSFARCSSDYSVNSFYHGQMLNLTLLKELSVFGCKSALINSSRDRYNKISLKNPKTKKILNDLFKFVKETNPNGCRYSKMEDKANSLTRDLIAQTEAQETEEGIKKVIKNMNRIEEFLLKGEEKICKVFERNKSKEKIKKILRKISLIYISTLKDEEIKSLISR